MDHDWSVAELAIVLERGQVLLVDLRSVEQTATGHIPGSWLVPLATLADRLRDLDDPFRRQVADGTVPVALVIAESDRPTAAAMFAEVGVTTGAVVGGVAAWSRAGRPLNHGHH